MAQAGRCNKTVAKASYISREQGLIMSDEKHQKRHKNSMSGLGALILVVGPSGVGKDTLVDGAKATVAPSQRFFFPARTITRPSDAGGEDHIATTEAEFQARESSGDFLLSWRTHGLCYGISKDTTDAARRHGQAVVANVSRGVLDCARNRLQPVRIISVTASADAIRARLQARGREDAADIEARIARASAYDVSGGDVISVLNDGSPEDGIARMVEALETASSVEWNPAE